MASFLPVLSPSDIQQAAQLIYQSYNPSPTQPLSPEEQRRLNNELFELQKRWEAWGLVVQFLEHDDPNVQFFGAHTAQVKISRDWCTLPQGCVEELKALLVDLTGRCIVLGRNKVILRKLFVALSSLALKVAPNQWPEWIVSTATTLSDRGSPVDYILDFLEIAAEETQGADLLPARKVQMDQTLREAVPLVTQAIVSSLDPSRDPKQFQSAMKCLEAWLPALPASDLTPLIHPIMNILNPTSATHFIPATSAMLAILSTSALADGSGSRILTEPLLLWFAQWGTPIVADSIRDGADEVGVSLCKLLVGLGDHSTVYLAENIASSRPVEPAFNPILASSSQPPTRGQLVQTFLRLLLSFTSLPGYYGVDEEESEMTLGFWYLFQEALWNVELPEITPEHLKDQETEMWTVAKAVYAQLAAALRSKVRFPRRSGWPKDQVDKFQVYRRDIGDTLINAYYVLRNDMLAYYVNDIAERLSNPAENTDWEEVEATLHCIMSIQESIPVEPNEYLSRLFSQDMLGKLPTSGNNRLRRTTLGLIGSYSSWFTTLPPSSELLITVIRFVVAALPEPVLCLHAANALRDLCDANRTALAPHIAAFGELHAGLVGVPETEKAKVLQSIASVIQALPPEEGIAPVEAIVSPVVAKLFEALQSSSRLPDEARSLAIQQLQILNGVAKGLTRTADAVDFDDPPETSEPMRLARDDLRAVRLREQILGSVHGTLDMWSTDASVSDAISDLSKSITALPSDASLISLPPAPLLELVCQAAQRQLTSVWLSLANILVVQLNPASYFKPLRAVAEPDVVAVVRNVVSLLLQTALDALSAPGAMEANPDIVQDFFHFMEKVSHHFVTVFYQLPERSFDALIRCSVTSLSLQERYSLVSASAFMSSLITRTHASEELGDVRNVIAQMHGSSIMRALLVGFAGIAPKSAVPNLVELFSTLVNKYPTESKTWITQILFADDFVQSKAGPEAKQAFMKAVFTTGNGALKRRRDAVRQFTIVARGQDGTNFGHAW
ncbi:armadillo-type protein [Amylostereum chailletii]|nr:armadillo-type protein [Amylostereum chailletii]